MAEGTQLIRPRQGSRVARAATVAALFVAIFLARLAVDEPGAGVAFLWVVPVMLAALWFGRWGGLGAGLAAGGLFVLSTEIQPQPEVPLATGVRLVTFCTVGYFFAILFEQQVELRRRIAAGDEEIAELRAIQEALVPVAVPERPGLDVATCYVPAESGAGGDFHLVTPGPGDDTTVVVIGDVVGKGLEAARRASFVRTALSTFAPYTDDPVRLLEMANRWLIEHEGRSEKFVTAACVVFHARDRRVDWALAGHPPPLALDAGQTVDPLRPGVPLGVEPRVGAAAGSFTLAPDAGLLLYTDGLIEARPAPAGGVAASENGSAPGPNGAPDQFGIERICAHLASARGAPPQQIVERLRDAAQEHAGGALPDDLCLLALRATGTPAGAAATACRNP